MEKKTIEVQEAHSLKELLFLVENGAEVILTEGTAPVARLLPVESPSIPRIAGLHQGAMWTSEDFDAPLPEVFELPSKAVREPHPTAVYRLTSL